MKKKKEVTKDIIIKFYMDYVLENNTKPKSVYSFAKLHEFDEAIFYNFFGSFEALEKLVFNTFFTNTINILEADKPYVRSYVVYALNGNKNNLKGILVLSKLKQYFSKYIANLDIETLDIKQDTFEKIQTKALQESAWIQFLITIKFWLDDTSAGFEKTDIFIEKSVNTSFDVINIAPLKSVIDFGKFLFKEKMQAN